MLPKIEGQGMALARNLMTWLDHHLVHARLTPRSMWQIGTRTPEEILASRRVATAFGCLDKVSVIAAILKENGVESWVVWQRVYHQGKPIGIHFLVEAKQHGKEFTIDPHTVRTDIYEGWDPREKEGHLSQPFKGTTTISYKRVNRIPVGSHCEKRRSFDITGVKSRTGYLRASEVPLRRYLHFVLSRSGRKNDTRIKRVRERRNKKK